MENLDEIVFWKFLIRRDKNVGRHFKATRRILMYILISKLFSTANRIPIFALSLCLI